MNHIFTVLLAQSTSIEPGQFDDFNFDRLLDWLSGIACLGINLVGILTVIAFAVSAIIYMTAGGNTGRADHAKTAVKISFIAAIILFGFNHFVNITVSVVEWIFSTSIDLPNLNC
jgi:hypothetical protein